MRAKLLAAAIAVIVIPGAATAGYELKGLSPGMPLSDVGNKYPLLDCGRRLESRQFCYYQHSGGVGVYRPAIEELDTLAGAPTESWIAYVNDDKVGRITVSLSTRHFDLVSGAIAEKYGKPTSTETSTIETKAGVKYAQTEITWASASDGQVLIVRRYGGNVNTMTISLTSAAELEADRARREAEKKKGAKDL